MRKVNVIIPAAGEGTRLRPLSTNLSKAMVPVNGKPCISYILDKLFSLSNIEIENVVIVDGKFDDIREYVSAMYPDKPIHCVKQGSLDGPRDAVAVGAKYLLSNNYDKEEAKYTSLVVWLGDAIILEDFEYDEDLFYSNLLYGTEVEDQSAWCVYDGKNFYNKPKENIVSSGWTLALVGLYVMSDCTAALNSFVNCGGYDISNALEMYEKETGYSFKLQETQDWYDIGELTTYYKTCAALLNRKARAFNTLSYNADLNTITKSSRTRPGAILAEMQWYRELDDDQKMLTPKFYAKDDKNLRLSFESGTLVSDLFLYGDLSENNTRHILNKIMHTTCNYFHKKPSLEMSMKILDNTEEHWVKKTSSRIEKIEEIKNSITLRFWSVDIARKCSEKTIAVECMHGDLHGGNIIHNPYTDQLTFIDPRGSFGSIQGKAGDALYDWAKLAHDFHHGYGEIIANRKYNKYVKPVFRELLTDYSYSVNMNMELIIDAGALLLLTCVPLHSENESRQKIMIDTFKEHMKGLA